MNTLIEKRKISEMTCGSNFSYILEDHQMFSSTEYKVLQSRSDSCFVKCMKMQMNGFIQLYYLTSDFKPLSALLPSLDPDSFLVVVSNMLSDIIEVKQNGFLSCQNIDISFDRIYVDPSTLKISLNYIPLVKTIYSDYSVFENELRSSLIRTISDIANISSNKTKQFSNDLANGMLSLEELHSHIKGGVWRERSADIPRTQTRMTASASAASSVAMDRRHGKMTIVAMNAPERVEIVINKDSFVIGKKAGMCDAVISFNKMISRAHCRIDHQGNQYVIVDLHSANGTFVNRQRIQPDRPVPIKNGDVIRLANSDFQVCEQ